MRRPLTLLARSTTLHVIIGSEEIARHVRSYDTVQIIEQETHVAGVVATTRDPNAARTRGRVRLAAEITVNNAMNEIKKFMAERRATTQS